MHSHDGLRDSLTHLASAGLFYEELRREIARARRSCEPISLARFVLKANRPEFVDLTPSEIEIELLSFSQTLSRLTRTEDICARIGDLEFLVLLRGNEGVANQLTKRVASVWQQDLSDHAGLDFRCRVTQQNSHLEHIVDESPLEFLNRLDRLSLGTETSR